MNMELQKVNFKTHCVCLWLNISCNILLLLFNAFYYFSGSYFCYDNPAALQDTMLRDLDISVGSFMMLYSLYSWPNVILCYFGGVLTDSVFGVRLAAIVFSTIVLSAQVNKCILLTISTYDKNLIFTV